jgi:hypothetical protein
VGLSVLLQSMPDSLRHALRLVQLHVDACFKMKHLAKCGARHNATELDAKIPRTILLTDAERDRRDARIAADLQVAPAKEAEKTCNEFHADNADAGCASAWHGRCNADTTCAQVDRMSCTWNLCLVAGPDM